MRMKDDTQRKEGGRNWYRQRPAGLPIVSIPAFVVGNMAARRNITKKFAPSFSGTSTIYLSRWNMIKP
jgi:hypothetical protein